MTDEDQDIFDISGSPLMTQANDGRYDNRFTLLLLKTIYKTSFPKKTNSSSRKNVIQLNYFRLTLLGISSYQQVNDPRGLFTKLTSPVISWIQKEAETNEKGLKLHIFIFFILRPIVFSYFDNWRVQWRLSEVCRAVSALR